jgi:hypothetical protein
MNLRLGFVAIALVLSVMLFGAGVYESVVVAPNFQGAPTSLEHARGFYHATNPGTFFRMLSPATQLFPLVALVSNWRPPVTRWRLAGALALAVLGDVITFQFHYPRNAILFGAPLTGRPAADFDRVATQWAAGNYTSTLGGNDDPLDTLLLMDAPAHVGCLPRSPHHWGHQARADRGR